MDKSTVNNLWRPFYDIERWQYVGERCAVCGRYQPLNKHHLVKRSAGNLYKDGERVHRPLITLCGFGNNLKDADGRFYCHGLAHHNMLHFVVFGGELYFALFDEPISYLEALKTDNWKKVKNY